jgi:phage gp36-like protein
MVLPVSIAVVTDVMTAQPLLSSADYITSAVVALQMGKTEAMIWGKISRRYAVPILPAPPLIVAIDIDLTIYDLLVKQAILANTLENSPWPDRYKESIDMLDDIATGKIALIDSSGSLITQAATAGGVSYVSGQIYNPTYADGLRPEDTFADPDKIQDARDARGIPTS